MRPAVRFAPTLALPLLLAACSLTGSATGWSGGDPPTAEAVEVTAEVTRVSFAARSDGKGYVVRLHTTGRVPAYRVEQEEPGRVELTLFQTGLAGSVRRGDPLGPIRGYEFSSAGGHTTVAFETDPAVPLHAKAYPDRDSDHLLLGVTLDTPTADPAAGGDHWALDCIVVDAGHGGKDGGATKFGVREKDVALGIALKLGAYVEDRLGIRVVYTRDDDRFIELHDRGRIANESCGKLFVSIHVNAAGSSRARGTETYFLGLHRSESARGVMERENSVVALEGNPDLYAGMDDAALVMQTMAQATYLRTSEQLAALIQDEFEGRAGRHSRGVKQAGFLVLWRASMPAVLVETGFVTNREEARFLASDRGQDLIASAVFRAIRDYKAVYERGLAATQ